MWIVVGLGNPGEKYARDRHNIGFLIVDMLAQQAQAPWHASRFQSLLTKLQWNDGAQQALLVKPLTYMNLSGDALAPLCEFYQVSQEQVLVVHDDLELPFGRIQLKRGGGESGHRGLLSITETLEDRNYLRLRFGIGRPPSPNIEISDFVLSPFTAQEQEQLPELIESATAGIQLCCETGETQAMNQINRRKSM